MLDPFSPVPMRSLTVKGIGLSAAIPTTRRANFWGLRSSTAPKPRLVASARHKHVTCEMLVDRPCALAQQNCAGSPFTCPCRAHAPDL